MVEKHIVIWGEPSVEPLMGEKLREGARLYLIIGPTGAGKSSFIESFSGKSQKLSISKDQLEGYTQTVTVYELLNVSWRDEYDHDPSGYGDPMYLVDTPGFSDSKISELEVMDMIRHFLETIGMLYVNHIFFFIPINTPRLAGSRRQTISMFKSLLKDSWRDITFITTMWDTLHNDNLRRRADSNFVQLRDEILAEFIGGGASIIRFTNTKQSPEELFGRRGTVCTEFFGRTMGTSPHGAIIYQDLLDRIKSGQQKQKSIEDDLNSLDAEVYPKLQEIQERNYEQNQELLWKFFGQYLNFIDPPAQFSSATFDVDKTIIEATGSLQPLSPFKDLLHKYNYEDPNSVRRNWKALHKHLQYAFLCEEVKRTLREKETTERDLGPLDDTANSEETFVLEQQHIENQQGLTKVVAQWIRFDDPPDEIDAVTQDIRKLVIYNSDLIQHDSAYEDVFYLWEQQPGWFPSFYERPEENGVFDDGVRAKLKKRRQDHESRPTSPVPSSSLSAWGFLYRYLSRYT